MRRRGAAISVLLWACSGSESTPPGPGPGAGADGGATSGADAAPIGEPTLTSIGLAPDRAELVSIDGARPSQDFVVIGRYTDGSTREIRGARFLVEPFTLGTVDAEGHFTASGVVGGTGRLRASLAGLDAEAALSVRLESELRLSGAPTDAPARFGAAPTNDPARAAQILYPLDGVVMPQNAYPATIQWSASAPNDLFRVVIEKPSFRLVAYLAALPGFDDAFRPEVEAWRRLAGTDPDDTAQIRVDRIEAATGDLLLGAPVSLRFARAALGGSVYYWDIVAGRIVRIDDGTATRQSFMPSPPQGCVGCHSVSRSGRYMAGRFGGGDNVGSVLDLTRDLSGSPPPLEFPLDDTVRWWFSSWSPDDTRMVVSRNEGGGAASLAFLDPRSGRFVDPLEGTMPAGFVTHPDWAPDGSGIAYVGNADAWGGANTLGDIMILPVLGPDRVGPSRVVVAGSQVPGAPAGNAASYPSYSPDAQRLAFAHGNSSRSETGLSALYLIKPDGTELSRLDKASGGTTGELAFQPRFSPFRQGGYYWLSFLSRRDYGNAKAGTLGTNRQQIWVTAIKEAPAPGEDPSEVPYWLPGQDTASLNISAYWAPRACREAASGCAVDAECCSGACTADPSGGLSCADAPTGCKDLGQSCVADADCCGGVPCIAGLCGAL